MVRSIHVDAFDHTTFEYYPGNKVLVRTKLLGCNTVLALYKPGIFNDGRGYVQCPVLTISTNGTGIIPGGSFGLLDRMVGHAVSILNKEKDGKIRTDYINNFDMGRLPEKTIYFRDKFDKSPSHIPQSQLEFGGIYEEESGRQSIHFGNCHLYYYDKENTYIHSNNRDEDKKYSIYVYGTEELITHINQEIYLSEKQIQHDFKIDSLYDISIPSLNLSTNCVVSCKTPRKFVRKISATHIPDDANFIRILNNAIKLDNSIMIIRRKSKRENMKEYPIDLSIDYSKALMDLLEKC